MFGMAAILAVAGVLLLLPPGAVGTPLPPATEPPAGLIEADGMPHMADVSARTSSPGRVDPVSGHVPRSVASGPPARVRVAAIGVDARVIPLGVDADGHLQVPDEFSVAGWWQGGAEPGEPGPTVLVGHVDSYQGPAVFYRLQDLEVGDKVVDTVAGGHSLAYRVTGTQEVPKDDFPTQAVYGHTPGPTLRLITCGGPFDRTTGHYRHNTIVFAEPT
jgi:LPXTG-site transpeptidase (sortase) family protein